MRRLTDRSGPDGGPDHPSRPPEAATDRQKPLSRKNFSAHGAEAGGSSSPSWRDLSVCCWWDAYALHYQGERPSRGMGTGGSGSREMDAGERAGISLALVSLLHARRNLSGPVTRSAPARGSPRQRHTRYVPPQKPLVPRASCSGTAHSCGLTARLRIAGPRLTGSITDRPWQRASPLFFLLI
jgi:hypothetical protein